MRIAAALFALLLAPSIAEAAEADAWLDGLYDRVAADLRAGRPLVVEVLVPLCDNRQITCGGHGLGDGEDLERNLYWATTGGFRGWFGRRGSGWRRVHRDGGDGAGVLETLVWTRRFAPSEALRRRGVARPFDVYLVGHAFRGGAIDDAVERFVADVFGGAPRSLRLEDGTALEVGGAAQVVAWVGHNRLMDRPPYDFAAARHASKGAPRKGVIAIACHTADYLAEDVPSKERVPLLFTRDFLFAGSHSLDGAVQAFAAGGDLAAIRAAAAHAYADGEGKTFEHVRGAFTNPSDPRWRGPGR